MRPFPFAILIASFDQLPQTITTKLRTPASGDPG